MPYAANGQISQSPISGGIKITQALYRTALDGMMAGKVVTIVDGVMVVDFPPPVPGQEPEPEPIDPLDQPATKRQLIAALILGGGILEPDAFIENAISAVLDPVGRALALNDWRNAPYYVRSHALFNDPSLLAATGWDGAQVDQLWGLSVTLPK